MPEPTGGNPTGNKLRFIYTCGLARDKFKTESIFIRQKTILKRLHKKADVFKDILDEKVRKQNTKKLKLFLETL